MLLATGSADVISAIPIGGRGSESDSISSSHVCPMTLTCRCERSIHGTGYATYTSAGIRELIRYPRLWVDRIRVVR